jgi:hypothetical protein
MSEAAEGAVTTAPADPAAADTTRTRVTELRVSGHLMTLDAGLFCVFQAPGAPLSADGSGLPGVRISLPPGPASRPEAVRISAFRDDGWLTADSAALVRITDGQAQILVTVYQSPLHTPDMAPRLQVLRLSAVPSSIAPAAAGEAVPMEPAGPAEVMAHIQRAGDVAVPLGTWLGKRGSRQWIEGFAVLPREGVAAEDIEYQAVLGRGWLSPWVEGGKFCGSRGMALPLLGIKVRLKGAVAREYACVYSATFVDGSTAGPVENGEACEAESLAALEALLIELRPLDGSDAATAKVQDNPAPARKAPVPDKAPRRSR